MLSARRGRCYRGPCDRRTYRKIRAAEKGLVETRVACSSMASGSQGEVGRTGLPAACFNAFVADTYSAITGTTPEGLPTLHDGLRAARIVDAVLDAAASGAWTPIEGTSE